MQQAIITPGAPTNGWKKMNLLFFIQFITIVIGISMPWMARQKFAVAGR